jgi:pimeloyl-ACP methyl ester carboxylesterase
VIPLRHAADRTACVPTPDGARLRVHLRGPEDAPVTVVLAHGWAQGSDTWRPQVARLVAAEDAPVRTVRWDQRGHGGSTLGSRPLRTGLLAEDLLRVVDACAPRGPVVLGGHALGGMAVLALAAARPELFGTRIAGVLLASASAGGLDTARPGFPLAQRVRGAGWRAAMRLLATAAGPVDRVRELVPPHLAAHRAVVRRAVFGPVADPLRVRECAELLHATPTRVVADFHRVLMRHDVTGRIGALAAVPAVLLAGGRDRLVPLRHVRALARALPDAELRVLPACGHMLPLEAPREVGDALAALCRTAARPG